MSHPRKRARSGQDGFTLVELLAVVLIIGILASIAIPSFLDQRTKAQDMAAKSAVRSGVIAAESYYVESIDQTFTGMVPVMLASQEQNVVWTAAAPASAKEDEVFVGTFPVAPAPVQNAYVLASRSETGRTFVYYRADTGAAVRCSGPTDDPTAWAAAAPAICGGAYPDHW